MNINGWVVSLRSQNEGGRGRRTAEMPSMRRRERTSASGSMTSPEAPMRIIVPRSAGARPSAAEARAASAKRDRPRTRYPGDLP